MQKAEAKQGTLSVSATTKAASQVVRTQVYR